MRLILLAAITSALGACTQPGAEPIAHQAPQSVAPSVATPQVDAPPRPQDFAPAGLRILADPPPPYLYWAPAGSVIVNHPNLDIWLAEIDGERVAYYYGDDCGAAELQAFVGQPVAALEHRIRGRPVRIHSRLDVVTSDLILNRVNLLTDGPGGLIERIECY